MTTQNEAYSLVCLDAKYSGPSIIVAGRHQLYMNANEVRDPDMARESERDRDRESYTTEIIANKASYNCRY